MTDTPEQLAALSCVPCRRGATALAPEEVQDLLAAVPDWLLRDAPPRIERTLRFKDFAAAFAFVTRVAAVTEAEGHHPDISFGWGYATVSLHTHAIAGLHRNDFILAAKLDRLVDG